MRFLLALLVLVLPAHALAATLSVLPPDTAPAQGDEFAVAVALDPESLSINAVEGTIRVSENLEIQAVRLDGSIVSYWVEQPTVAGGAVRFAGVIPGGFEGALREDRAGAFPGVLFTLIVSAKAEGEGALTIDTDARAYQNDGEGTPAPLARRGAAIVVAPGAGFPARVEERTDREAPEPFTLSVESGEPFEQEGKVLIFKAFDKGTGVAYYELSKDDTLFGFLGLSRLTWVRVESPYPVSVEDLATTIRVRATDAAGNARIATLMPIDSSRTLFAVLIVLSGIVFVCALILIARRFRRRG